MSRPQHICIRPLTVHDIQQVLTLEHHGFPAHERASALRLEYRLTTCPELCSGLFVREFDNESVKSRELPDHSTITKETLIGHIIGTKMHGDTVTDQSMMIPKSFTSMLCDNTGSLKAEFLTNELKQLIEKDDKESSSAADFGENELCGHTDAGKTIGIHSVVIHPDYRGKKLASLLIKDYLQKMSQQYVAETISLLCKDKLVKFYSGFGFSDAGVSECSFAGEEWHDMTITLEHEEDED